jgi:hypothetical protein
MATTITSAGVTFSDSSTLTTKAASSTYRGDAYGIRYTFDSTERTGTGASDGPAKGNFSLNSSTLDYILTYLMPMEQMLVILLQIGVLQPQHTMKVVTLLFLITILLLVCSYS